MPNPTVAWSASWSMASCTYLDGYIVGGLCQGRDVPLGIQWRGRVEGEGFAVDVEPLLDVDDAKLGRVDQLAGLAVLGPFDLICQYLVADASPVSESFSEVICIHFYTVIYTS